MIIEFVGLPGSGKTHLSQEFSKQENIPVIVVNRFEKIILGLFFILKHPVISSRVVFSIFKYLFKYDFLYLKHFIFDLFFFRVARLEKALLLKKGIIDEGFLMLSVSFCSDKNSFFQLNKLYKRHNIKVCIINSTEDKIIQRMQERKRFPRNYFGKDESENWMIKTSKCYNKFISELNNNLGCDFIEN